MKVDCGCDMPMEIYNDWLRDQGWDWHDQEELVSADRNEIMAWRNYCIDYWAYESFANFITYGDGWYNTTNYNGHGSGDYSDEFNLTGEGYAWFYYLGGYKNA